MTNSTNSWLTICGQEDKAFEESINSRVNQRIANKDYSENDCKVIADMRMSVVKGDLKIDDYTLEKLRHMCQLWDIDLRPREITSHRKIVGPIIVGIKKMLFPILKIFLKDLIRQQRDFNAATIRLVGCLSNKN